jgi:LuxR family maltose regulon positive regulatory protein
LETAEVFAFDGPEGHFTAHKRQRGEKWYWYAYSRRAGRLRTLYLGKSGDLELERLRTIARAGTHDFEPFPDEVSIVPIVMAARLTHAREVTHTGTAGLHLIPTKLAVPRPPAAPLVRSQAISRLDRAIQLPLTVVSAPAGYGKTSLLAQWIATARMPVAWVALDKGDDDPVRFWTYVLAALDTVVPGMLAQVLPILSQPERQLSEAALSTIVVALARAPDPTMLVLDDYHAVEQDNAAIHEALAYLVGHLPPQVHVVLAGRTEPSLPLARLRVLGHLSELRALDLRLGQEEVACFLTHSMGLNLTTDQIAAIDARTEGWIAGLQLAALSLQAREDPASWISSFSGGSRYIFDYLMDEVLERLSPDQRQFLLETSLFDRIAAPLCDAVTASTRSQTRLEELERANLFLVPLDDQRRWYRYHPLFADVLRLRLLQTQPERVRELYSRAEAWYEAHELWEEAVDSALAAAHNDRAARLIESLAERMLASGRQATLRHWLDRLPEAAIRPRPHLCAVHAYVLILRGQFNAFERRLLDAEDGGQRAAQTLSQDGRGLLQGEMLALRAAAAALHGHLDQCIALSQQALSYLSEGHAFRNMVIMNLGVASWLYGAVPAANQLFEVLRRRSEDQHNPYSLHASITYLVQMRILQGRLREAVDLCAQMMRRVAEHGLRLEGNGIRIGLGMALFRLNDLDAAREHLERAVSTRQTMLALTSGYPTLAYVCQAQGDSAAALKWMRCALERVERVEAGVDVWLPGLQALQAHLWLMQDNLEAASRWARQYVRQESTRHEDGESAERMVSLPPLLRERERIVLSEVYIAQRRMPEALAVLAELLTSAEAGDRVDRTLEILVLQAVAYAAQEDIGGALVAMRRALALAEPEGHVRVFLAGGAMVRRLLERLRAGAGAQISRPSESRDHLSIYIDRLLAAFNGEGAGRMSAELVGASARTEELGGARQPLAPITQPLVSPLSERELEVLRLLASGASNEDLVRELVIAMSTVKRHVSNILSKLGVRRRTQAIARAYALHLIAPQMLHVPKQHRAT